MATASTKVDVPLPFSPTKKKVTPGPVGKETAGTEKGYAPPIPMQLRALT